MRVACSPTFKFLVTFQAPVSVLAGIRRKTLSADRVFAFDTPHIHVVLRSLYILKKKKKKIAIWHRRGST